AAVVLKDPITSSMMWKPLIGVFILLFLLLFKKIDYLGREKANRCSFEKTYLSFLNKRLN
ncbi:MAG: hypothetical protein IJM98_11015, partial [Oscillospiraceae bacterium]|nr:hypothetical protein [Oscillospiraceae bacterium]